jgi:hypothetical protein
MKRRETIQDHGPYRTGRPSKPSNGATEHPGKCDTIDVSGMEAKPDNPAGELINNNQSIRGPHGERP